MFNFCRATLPMVDADAHAKCDIHTDPAHTDDLLNSSPRRHSSVDEIFGLMSSVNLNGQRQRSLSDSGGSKEKTINGKNLFLFIYTNGISSIYASFIQL